MDLQPLAGFGIQVAKGDEILTRRRSRMVECMASRGGGKEGFRREVIKMAAELVAASAMPQHDAEKMSRVMQLVVMTMFLDRTIPKLDWSHMGPSVLEEIRGRSPARADASEKRDRLHVPAASSRGGESDQGVARGGSRRRSRTRERGRSSHRRASSSAMGTSKLREDQGGPKQRGRAANADSILVESWNRSDPDEIRRREVPTASLPRDHGPPARADKLALKDMPPHRSQPRDRDRPRSRSRRSHSDAVRYESDDKRRSREAECNTPSARHRLASPGLLRPGDAAPGEAAAETPWSALQRQQHLQEAHTPARGTSAGDKSSRLDIRAASAPPRRSPDSKEAVLAPLRAQALAAHGAHQPPHEHQHRYAHLAPPTSLVNERFPGSLREPPRQAEAAKQGLFPPEPPKIPNLPVASGAEPLNWARFEEQRQRWPPLTVQQIHQEQTSTTWCPMAEEHADAFEFCCSEATKEDCLWLWWRQLAKAGIYCDLLYHNSGVKPNAWAYRGSSAQPCVSTALGPSITWFVTGDGYLKVDGHTPSVQVLNAMLRRAFPLYVVGRTAHGQVTGKQKKQPRQHQGQQTMEQQRGAWVAQRRGKVLVLAEGIKIYDPMERDGVMDVLDNMVGLKVFPSWNVKPWVAITRTGLAITVSEQGKVSFQLGAASADSANVVEQAFLKRLAATWVSLQDAEAIFQLPGRRIQFGMQGLRMMEKASGLTEVPPFRSAGPSNSW